MNWLADKIEQWPTAKLLPYARNARTHSEKQLAQIAASIKEFGFVNPCLVGADGVLVAGHGRLAAARKLGLPTVPVVVLDHLTPTQRRALVIADNRIAENAGWDEELLRLELGDLQGMGFDLELIGFDADELAGLRIGLADEVEGLTDEDEVPEPQAEVVTQPGDVWLLGRHRLMCGDSTSAESLERLIGSDVADVCVFDPPYEVEDLYYRAMPAADPRMKLLVFWDFKRFGIAPHAAIQAGWKPQYEMVWDCVTSWYTPNRPLARHKSVGVFGEDPKWNFDEAIIRDGKQREAKQVWNTRGEYAYTPLDGAVHMRTVEAFPTTAEHGGHAHSKPIAWVEALFNGVGGSVYVDLFGGSGSTLVACEKTGRRALLMELDPRYVDVIVRRWQAFTGKQATLDIDGRTFDEVCAERAKEPQ